MSYLRTSASFARPADTTAYAAGDLVANSTTAGSVVVPSVTLPRIASAYYLRGLVMRKSTATVANASFNIYVYSGGTPVPSVGDNAALVATQVFASTGAAFYRGAFVVAATNWRAHSDGNVALASPLLTVLPNGMLIGAGPSELALKFLIEATAAYAPGNAETFTLTPWYEPVVDDPTV